MIASDAQLRAGVATRHSFHLGWWIARVVIYAVVLLGAVLFATPFVWMLSTSVKPGYEVFKVPPVWIPSTWQWDNYWVPWSQLPFLSFYRNTTIMTCVDIVATMVSSSLVAFGFSRMRFRGRGVLFILVLATMMLPPQVTLIPIYVLWSRLHLVNSLWPLMIPSFFGSAFNIFLLRQFMMTIPLQMDDAARIDGANWFQIYSRIILPLASPALGVVAIYEFTFRWNDFLGPLIYLNDPANFTVTLGLQLLNSQYVIETQRIMAQTTISIIPVLVVFFVAQRYYLQGLVITGIKG
jgi:ABC-type glycerol-3-phosphate transport system permease component